MTMVDAVQALLSDWHRRRSESFSPVKAIDFLTHVCTRALNGHEPAARLLRAEGLPPADVRPRPYGERIGKGGPDVDFVEYVETMLDVAWAMDCDQIDSPIEIEDAWEIQNRLRRLFGIEEIHVDRFRRQLGG